jgi:hypothetical protein
MHRRDTSSQLQFTSAYQNWQTDCYKYMGVRADQIRNSYSIWDFGKCRLLSLFKSVFSMTKAILILLLLLLILVLLQRRLFRIVLLTVHCISAGTSLSTSSASRNCISTTCIAVIKSERCGVLVAKCHIVIHRVPVNLINWSRIYQRRIELLAAASIHGVMICATAWLHCVH